MGISERASKMKAGGQLADYQFHDLDPFLDDDQAATSPKAGFTFGGWHSPTQGLFVITRDAPTPSEQEITESIPYSQGILDFSMLGGQRYFANRDVSFTLELFNEDYPNRSAVENATKRALMPLGIQSLYDTHNPGYHWLGKCKSVSVDDDEAKHTLILTIVFDCYPFAIRDVLEGDDRWNDVIFDSWVFQPVKFDVDGPGQIKLLNVADNAITPTLVVSGSITISGNFGTLKAEAGTYSDSQLSLAIGANYLSVDGSGSIEFQWHEEAML